MGQPNSLIFVDFPAPDPAEAGAFYAAVFGWENDVRMNGNFSRMVPGGNFLNPDGSESQIGNLHMGVYNPTNARPHPDPEGPVPKTMAGPGAKTRVFVMVSDDDTPERILGEAEKRGAWLEAVESLARWDAQAALALARCARLVKGYSHTRERGHWQLAYILRAVEGGCSEGQQIEGLLDAAMVDDEARAFASRYKEVTGETLPGGRFTPASA